MLGDCGVPYRKTQTLHSPHPKSPSGLGFVPSQDRWTRVHALRAGPKGLMAEHKQQPLIQQRRNKASSPPDSSQRSSAPFKQFFWLRPTQGIPSLPSHSPFNSKAQRDLEFSLAFGSFHFKFETAMGCVPFLLAPGSRPKAVQTFQTSVGHGPGLNLSQKNYKQLKEQVGRGKEKKKRKKGDGEKKSPNQLAVAISPHVCQGLQDFLLEGAF